MSNNSYTCNKCGRTGLLAGEITWIHKRFPGQCIECRRAYQREYKKNNPQVLTLRQHRNKQFKYKYGITIEEYDEILISQGNKCRICLRMFDGKIKPDVDHCHSGDFVRGILCHTCNVAIGYFQDDIEIVQRLPDYLKEAQLKTLQLMGEGDINALP